MKKKYTECVALRKEYWTIRSESETFIGGNQKCCSDLLIRRDGCGLIAAADVLGYLQDIDRNCSITEYWEYLYSKLESFHVLPNHGMPSWAMVLGMSKCFRKEHLPYRIMWGGLPKRRYKNVIRMLSQDIPVIIAVGPNFPNRSGSKVVKFYEKTETGEYREAASTKGHYVVGLGIEHGWLKISSWGKIYYINWQEFDEYASKISFFFYTNICCITRKQ